MLPLFEVEEQPQGAAMTTITRLYRPILDFLEQEGPLALCVIIALHIVSTGMIMFLGGFLFAVPFWLLNLVPQGGYPSIAVQVGTVVAYVLVLIAPIPLWRLLRRFPGCQAAIITIIAWEVLVIRWFCVEDDRTSVMARFLCHAIVRNILFLGSLVMLVYGGTLAWQSSRGSGTWIQRIWIVAVLGEIFVLQEFYRNGV